MFASPRGGVLRFVLVLGVFGVWGGVLVSAVISGQYWCHLVVRYALTSGGACMKMLG